MRESDRFGLGEPGVLPCLTAAKGLGLILRYSRGAMRLSQYPNEGWWGRKSYGASTDLGGPWSVEFVFRLCELGLLSLDPQSATSAHLTKAGKIHLRNSTAKAARDKISIIGAEIQ